MIDIPGRETCASQTGNGAALLTLVPLRGEIVEPDAASCHPTTSDKSRIFQLDARFESAGAWAGVEQLVEMAYLGLLELEQNGDVEEHHYELYMVLFKYRDRIAPRHLCLTDTAAGTEKTRFYALDRAYRLVHGLVGMVLQWKQALRDARRWVVVVRNFDHAQHLATRFFVELARRAAPDSMIDVVIETENDLSALALRLPGMQAVRAAPWIADLPRDGIEPRRVGEYEMTILEQQIAEGQDALVERRHSVLLAYHRSSGDGLAAARIALKAFTAYCRNGYYHEASSFIGCILPYFDQLMGGDEFARMNCVSDMNSCLAMTDDPAGALRVVMDFAAPYLTRPHLLANMNYILAMHYLRFAETKNIELAEQYILQAVEYIASTKDHSESRVYPFLKAFIDNGLAFLRVRQGRHQEAVNLCQAGYQSLTSELGEDQHLLHRSVLQYNTAQVYVMLGRLEEGLEYYNKAIRMDPYYSEYHNESGNILQRLDRHHEAMDCYVRAIRYSAPYPEVYFNKAICHARQEQWQEALSCFATSLELNPQQAEIYALRAELFEAQDRPDEALTQYDLAIALGHDAMAVRVNRAVLHFNNGSYALALADMDHVIARDGHDAAHYENRAAIHQAMRRQDLYLHDLEMADRYRETALS